MKLSNTGFISVLFVLLFPLCLHLHGQTGNSDIFVPSESAEKIARHYDSICFPLFLQSLEDQRNGRYGMVVTFFNRVQRPVKDRQTIVLIKDLYCVVPPVFKNTVYEGVEYPLNFPQNWSDSVNPNPTWMLYFSSLKWLEPLLKSRNIDTVFTALKVIDDWLGAHTTYPATQSRFAFDDHGVAIRLEVLGLAYRRYFEMGILDDQFRLRLQLGLISHIFFVSSLEKYSCWHNHAIIYDEKLINTLRFLPEFTMQAELEQLAITRIVEQFRYSFTSEGVHKESSPCYHRQFSETLEQLCKTAGEGGILLPGSMQELRNRAMNYTRQVYRMWPSFPVGDCARNPARPDEWKLDKLGRKMAGRDKRFGPPENFRFLLYPSSGWLYAMDTSSRVKVVAQSDFFSFSHYQKDETSFIVHAGEHELVIDPGLFSYEPGAIQRYYRSMAAHNVLVADSLPDDFNEDYTGLSGITRSYRGMNTTGDSVLAVEMTHANYIRHKIRIHRQLLFPGRNDIVVRDLAVSRKRRDFCQLLHLAPGAIITPEGNGFFVRWNNHSYTLHISSNHDGYRMVEGALKPMQGWYFPKFRRMEPAPVLVLEKRGRKVTFETVISVNNQPDSLRSLESASDDIRDLTGKLNEQPRRDLIHLPYPVRWKSVRTGN